MLTRLQQKNPHLTLLPLTHDSFRQFGRIVDEYNFAPWFSAMEQLAVPASGNVYIAGEETLQALPLTGLVQQKLYAGMPIQVGYCNGKNQKLNALEYHKTPELDIAVTDLVLLLADVRDIRGNRLKTQELTGYYMPAGTACELYGTTLHFSPCAVSDAGFKSIVALPKGTNIPFEKLPEPACEEDELLWTQGKWLIAHSESVPASKGAYVGLEGENIQVFY